MNKQIIRRVSFVILPLLVVGAAVYLSFMLRPGEIEAGIERSNAFDLFQSYLTWPNSAAKKTGTAAEWLHTMSTNTQMPAQSIDINGDGLVDVVVHQENESLNSSTAHHYYTVLLNRGDLTFDFAYKCVVRYTNSVPDRYYGDCAQ